MQDTVELKLHSLAEIVGNPDVGVIVLQDKAGANQISVLCDKLMKDELQLRLSKKKVCNTMLPEILVNILRVNVGLRYELVINDIIDGVYRAMIIDTDTYQPLSLRAADAVMLHCISKIPLYATTQLMKRQALPVNPLTPAMALPYNALTDKMLTKALEAAVSMEKYELASIIRDELRKREKPDT